MFFEYGIKAGDFANAGKISSEIKKILKQLNIDHKTIKRIVISLYEAEVNVVAHSHGGKVSVDIEGDTISITAKDTGPGIPNIELAMQEGFSTASEKVREMGFGAGMGLPNIKNNTDSFDIKSEPGKGTSLTMTVSLVPEKVYAA